jgi:hypothetical protein
MTSLRLDCVGGADQSDQLARAEHFERILVDWFVAKGVRVQTQGQTTKEQKRELSKVVATPDLLLLDQVTINGHPVRYPTLPLNTLYLTRTTLFLTRTIVT